jgi:hypothetical protein
MASPLFGTQVYQPRQMSTSDRPSVTPEVQAAVLMDTIDALDGAVKQNPAMTIPAAETLAIPQSDEKETKAEVQDETKDFSAWLALPRIPNWTGPRPFIAKPPYGFFPPEIWLLIMKDCPTSSVKNLARTSKKMHKLAMSQLLETVVLGQGLLGRYTLPEALDNATMISDPALFATSILNHKQLYWYKAVKTVFVVFRSGLYVTRRSALPLVCRHITARFGPQEDLESYKWMTWTRQKVIVTLWLPGTWMVEHPIAKLMEQERRKILRGWWMKRSK